MSPKREQKITLQERLLCYTEKRQQRATKDILANPNIREQQLNAKQARRLRIEIGTSEKAQTWNR